MIIPDRQKSIPLREKIHAWLITRGAPKYDKVVRLEKTVLFSDIKGTILEIGPGTGINIQYLQQSIHYIGLEPNLAMSKYLKKELDKKIFAGSRVIGATAESIPLGDGSIDAVISTLTLCTIKNIKLALHEIKRVLKPGGVFFFIEHVAAPSETSLRKMQHRVKGIWRILGNGCNPEREIGVYIEDAGFKKVEMKKMDLPVIWIMSPHIIGRAIK